MGTIREYRETLEYLKNVSSNINVIHIFEKFLTNDVKMKLSDYIVIASYHGFETFDPYMVTPVPSIKDWQELNKKEGIEAISRYSYLGSVDEIKPDEDVQIRPKNNRKHIIYTKLSKIPTGPSINQYEMFDANNNRWGPIDPNYIEKYGNKKNIAIAFKTEKDYNDFVRKFILYAVRHVAKRPVVKKIMSLFGDMNI